MPIVSCNLQDRKSFLVTPSGNAFPDQVQNRLSLYSGFFPTLQAVAVRLSHVKESRLTKSDGDLQRIWERIAEEVSQETNQKKLLRLTKELVRALDDRNKAHS